jgi:hypothetical protein
VLAAAFLGTGKVELTLPCGRNAGRRSNQQCSRTCASSCRTAWLTADVETRSSRAAPPKLLRRPTVRTFAAATVTRSSCSSVALTLHFMRSLPPRSKRPGRWRARHKCEVRSSQKKRGVTVGGHDAGCTPADRRCARDFCCSQPTLRPLANAAQLEASLSAATRRVYHPNLNEHRYLAATGKVGVG